MNKTICILSATLVLNVIGSQSLRAADTSAAENAIRQAAKDFVEAYDHGNAQAVAAQWTTDGEYAIGPMKIKGRDAIAGLYAEFFRAHPGSKMDVKIDSIRVLAPTVAIEQGTASVRNSPNGPPSASSYTAIHLKQGDNWLMVGVRDSEAPTIQIDRDLNELAWMVGEWSATKETAKVTLACSWMADKHFLRAEVTVHGNKGVFPGGMQIIGRDPASGQIVSWFFSADGGYGNGSWQKDGSRWVIQSGGIAADGAPTSATNVLYQADKNVLSWQSTNRVRGDTRLPDVKEVVIERAPSPK